MKVGIFSLGLIGGSLLKSLAGKGIELVGVTRNSKTIEKAKKYCVSASDDINLLQDCDIVFVCCPISNVLEILDKLENVVKKDCIVTDVASVKSFVMKKKYSYKFIGSHPMAGLETSGFDAAKENLFEGAKWVVTPPDDVDEKDLSELKKIISLTGARTILANAQEHDLAVAYISHLPMLIAQALFKNADTQLAKQLASSGFRDTTRLAMTNNILANDMLKYNGENIKTAFDSLIKNANMLINDNNYIDTIEKITYERKNMYTQEGKNNY